MLMHGREPTCGFFGEPLQGGHLLLNVSVADYMDPELGETFMPVTMLLGRLQGASLRSAFAATPDAANARVTRPPSRLPLGRDGDHWLPWEANDFQQFIRGVASRKGTVPMLQFDQFFDSLFGRPPPRVLQVAQGAQFAADRTVLRRVPLPALRSLLELVEAGHAELPYYMEAVWFHLLHPDTLDAPIDGMPSNGGAPLPFLHHLGDPARRRLDHSYMPLSPPPPLPPLSPDFVAAASEAKLRSLITEAAASQANVAIYLPPRADFKLGSQISCGSTIKVTVASSGEGATLDGQEQSGLFYLEGGCSLTLRGLTLVNGRATCGGVVYASSSAGDIEIIDSDVRDCSAGSFPDGVCRVI